MKGKVADGVNREMEKKGKDSTDKGLKGKTSEKEGKGRRWNVMGKEIKVRRKCREKKAEIMNKGEEKSVN